MSRQIVAILFFFALGFSNFSHAQNLNLVNPKAHFKRVIYIIFENEEGKQVIKDAYFKKLADSGALFTSIKAESRPSQPNYIAMVAGDTFGVKTDNNVTLDKEHIGDLLESKNLTWRTYAEKYPGNCFTGTKNASYARKHVPFLSFKNVTTTAKCQNIVSEKTFFTDWKNNQLAHYNMYVPDLKNDGHDTSISYSSSWLQKTFGAAFNDPNMMKDTLVVLTYDEGAKILSKNQIYTALIGPMIKPKTQITEVHNHYSLLKMIEDEWALGSLNLKDKTAAPIKGLW